MSYHDYMKVTLYTKPNCRSCLRVSYQLKDAGVPFEVIDIEDPAFSDARTYVTQVLGAKSVPVVVSDVMDPILGYQPEKVKALVAALTRNERNA